MIDFCGSNITDIMPDNLKNDPAVQAIGYAISNIVKKIVETSKKAGVLAAIDILDEQMIDLLAVELRAQYYSNFLPLSEKRETVKKTLLWYYRAGTVSAVRELTELVWKSDSAQVQEWFRYGSAPFLFRILLDTKISIEEERIQSFLAALQKVKNTRSHLESITFQRRTDQHVYVGTAIKNRGSIVIIDTWHDNHRIYEVIHKGTAMTQKYQKIKIKEG